MTDRLRAAAESALEALERSRAYVYETDRQQIDDAIEQLRAALAETEPCWCDRQQIGEPGVSCGDCPTRDYQLRGATEMIDDRLRIERLVRANARRAMVIDIIERLVEDPEREDFGPSDMEYWGPLHDALREKLSAALAEPEAASEPFVWYDDDTGETWTPGAVQDGGAPDGLRPLYTAPPSALADPEVGQEPADDVWFEDRNGACRKSPKDCQRFGANGVPVAVWVNGNRYTRREWQSLTQEELEAALGLTECTDLESATNLIVAARAIEAALKEKNHD